MDGTGPAAAFLAVNAMCFDSSGNLLLACDSSIRKLAPDGVATTIAGSFSQTGFADGPPASARFNGVSGLTVSGATVYATDSLNHRIRAIAILPPPAPQPPLLAIENLHSLRLTGVVGRTYRIESSRDNGEWVAEGTLVLDRSPYLWVDEHPKPWKKSYRALLLP
jgi:hypothetical protein